MVYDFDKIIPRRGSSCVKWDAELHGVRVNAADPSLEGAGFKASDVIPLWVADMDFECAPFIKAALQKRLDHGVFGYEHVPDSTYESAVNWFGKKHGWKIEKDWILYTLGGVPALSAVVKAMTEPGDKVVILPPVYNCFYSSIKNNGCGLLESRLSYVREDGQMTYRIDYSDLEEKCADPAAKLMIFCNPHNPAGRVWTSEEMTKVAEIARRHKVAVFSDEIHSEIVSPGCRYTPFAAIDQENCISLVSSSKSFNTAGLQFALIVTSNPAWHKDIDKALNVNEVCDVSPFAPISMEAAFTKEGEEWLDQMNAYVHGNYLALCEAFAKDLPDFPVVKLEGTYLAWADIKALTRRGTSPLTSTQVEEELYAHEAVWINAGSMYGDGDFIRINLATQHKTFAVGLRRLVHGLRRLLNSVDGNSSGRL